MAFFKFRQRGPAEPEPKASRRAGAKATEAPEETIESLRRRARHRLIGTVVLVALAVIGFPLLFDTEPRPVALDAPITIPDRETAPPLQMPVSPPSAAVSTASSLGEREEVVPPRRPAEAAAVQAPARPVASEDSARAEREQARAQREAEAKTRAEEESAKARARQQEQAKAQAQREAEAKARAEEEAAKARARQQEQAQAKAQREAAEREAARARAALEGRSAAAPAAAPAASGERFIVQIGAFAEADKVREARQKAERAGLKTYTQVVDTKDGKRTRVRVGPFASRAEAEKAADALKRAGLPGGVLTL